MVTMFGLEDDENIGLLNKVSQVMSSNIDLSRKNVSQAGDDRKHSGLDNNASFFKGGCLTPVRGNSKSDCLLLKDISKIELVRSGTDNLISTERGQGFAERELEILKGRATKVNRRNRPRQELPVAGHRRAVFGKL